MSILETVAEFLADRGLTVQPPHRLERLKLHLLDTLGALIAGSRLEDAAPLHSLPSSEALACACAATRCTEIDDIHLSSCTTPGSVIVPAALHLASEGVFESWGEFAASVLAGYELLVRLGFAIDGPAVLAKQIWPTYFAAAFGSAATASRAFQLSAPQTAGALATALAFSTGTPSAAAGSAMSSRWLSVGVAAANGVLAARSAHRGLSGSPQILERNGYRIAGVDISASRLLTGLGQRFLFDDLGMKPFPVARQALAAIQAARELGEAEKIDVSSISEIVIGVPAPQIRVIDHPEPPSSRLGSIVSVQYQTALALLEPERLLDINRTPPYSDRRIRELMTKVRVQRMPELEEHYPEAWPGHARIKAVRGESSRTVIYPPGDPKNQFDAGAVAKKFRGLAIPHLGVRGAEELIDQVHQEVPAALWSSGLPFGG
ncbi:MAG TPA: MmgE/PrpD family protein [Bryobacteraceae bacterium]|nr:MmgE/PrpD family protein [Bryobacteraceae bacterium]